MGQLVTPAAAGSSFPGVVIWANYNFAGGTHAVVQYYGATLASLAVGRLGVGQYQITWVSSHHFNDLNFSGSGDGRLPSTAPTPCFVCLDITNGLGINSAGIAVFNDAGAAADIPWRGMLFMQ